MQAIWVMSYITNGRSKKILDLDALIYFTPCHSGSEVSKVLIYV